MIKYIRSKGTVEHFINSDCELHPKVKLSDEVTCLEISTKVDSVHFQSDTENEDVLYDIQNFQKETKFRHSLN